MRIALLTWAYPPEKSGLSRAAAEIAEALDEAGAEVCVFTMDRRGHGRQDRIDVVGCGFSKESFAGRVRRWTAIGHLAGPLAFRRAVLAEHRRRPFDVVEATNCYAPALALALGGPIPVVTRNSTPAAISAAAVRSFRDRLDRRAAMTAERRVARASAGLISNTKAHGDTIAALYGVPRPGPDHAVVGLSLPPAIVAAGKAATYPVDAERIELLFVGRDEPRKGFAELLDAHAMLAGDLSLPDYRLTIVGVGEAALASLPAAALARTRHFERVEEAMLHRLFAAAHIVVAPSRYESFGLVYQEAMTFGRPLVACAEDASARRFVGDGGAGLLAEHCTGEAIAAAVRCLLIDPALRRQMAATSRAASGRFTRATLARDTLAVYGRAIASKGSSSSRSSSGRPAPADMPS